MCVNVHASQEKDETENVSSVHFPTCPSRILVIWLGLNVGFEFLLFMTHIHPPVPHDLLLGPSQTDRQAWEENEKMTRVVIKKQGGGEETLGKVPWWEESRVRGRQNKTWRRRWGKQGSLEEARIKRWGEKTKLTKQLNIMRVSALWKTRVDELGSKKSINVLA